MKGTQLVLSVLDKLCSGIWIFIQIKPIRWIFCGSYAGGT